MKFRTLQTLRTTLLALIWVLASAAGAQQLTGTYTGASGDTADTQRVMATYPDGTTVTMVASSNLTYNSYFDGTGTAFSAQKLESIGDPTSSMYSPALNTGTTPAALYNVESGVCTPNSSDTSGTSTCDRGTLTISFSRAVTDPVLHISGIGGSATTSPWWGLYADTRTQMIFNLATPGVTLQSTGTPNNLSVTSTQITSSNTSSGTSCQTRNNSRGTTAGCGSVILKGTFTSVTFNMQIRSTQIAGSGTNPANNNLADDTVALTVTTTAPPASALQCSTQMYMIGGAPGSFYYTRTLQTNGTAGTTNINDWRQSGDSTETASLGVSPGGDKLYSASISAGTLRIYDVISRTYTTQTIPGFVSGDRILRMAVTSTGTGYMMSGTKLWSFNSAGVVNAPVTMTLSPNGASTTGFTPAVTINGGNGDFFADSEGNLYMLWSPTDGSSYMDLFKIKPDGTAYFLGRITDTTLSGKAYGGLATLNGKIYATATDGTMVSIDLVNMTVDPVAGALAARNTSDLASCYYPTLAPQITATKTVAQLIKGTGNTSASAQPGDTLEYRIVVRNSGSLNAANTKFYDQIPAGTTYVAGSTTMNFTVVADSGGVMPFSVTGGALIKSPNQNSPATRTTSDGTLYVDTTPGTIPSAAIDNDDTEAVITFRVKINTGVSQVSNQGTVTYLEAPSPVQTDDPGTPTPRDPTVTPVLIANLSITKTGPVSVLPGVTFSYMVTVKNNGPSSATGVSVVDTLPKAVTYVSSGPAATTGTDASGNTTLTWTPGTMASGATLTYTVTVKAPSTTTLQTDASSRNFLNVATVSSPSDSFTSDNRAEAVTAVVYVKLTKAVKNIGANPSATPIPLNGTGWGDSAVGAPGEVLEYCIDFQNFGGLAVQNLVLSDPLNTNTKVIVGTPVVNSTLMTVSPPVVFAGATTGVTTSGGVETVTGTLPNLPVGGSGSLCFRARIN